MEIRLSDRTGTGCVKLKLYISRLRITSNIFMLNVTFSSFLLRCCRLLRFESEHSIDISRYQSKAQSSIVEKGGGDEGLDRSRGGSRRIRIGVESKGHTEEGPI